MGRFRDIKDLQMLPVETSASGRTILLHIQRGPEKERSRTYYAPSGAIFQQAIDITLTKRPGTDAIKTIDAVKRLLVEKQATAVWPPALQTSIVFDESAYIIQDLHSVFSNGWQAMLAVFIILFISLTWREAIVAGLAIPITFAGALVIVLALGYSLNQLVIIDMVLALGLLVDDFILVMEGMHDNLYAKGRNFTESVVDTIKTYAIPSLSGSLTTILAMAPRDHYCRPDTLGHQSENVAAFVHYGDWRVVDCYLYGVADYPLPVSSVYLAKRGRQNRYRVTCYQLNITNYIESGDCF